MALEAVLDRAPFEEATPPLQHGLRLPRQVLLGPEDTVRPGELLIAPGANNATRNEDNDRILAELNTAYKDRHEVQFVVDRFRVERAPQRPRYSTMDDIDGYIAMMEGYKILEPLEATYKTLEVRMGMDLYRDIAKQGRTQPDQDEEQILMTAAAAREVLYMCNLRLAFSFAKTYFPQARPGISEMDFIQEANRGLGAAIARYDKSYKFITYASYLIRNSVRRKTKQLSRTMYVPEDQLANLQEVNVATEKLSEQLGRPATLNEITTSVEMDIEDVAVLLRANATCSSLNEPVEGMAKVKRVDLIEDTVASIEIDKRLDEISDKSDLERIVDSAELSTSELVILALRKGIVTVKIEEALQSVDAAALQGIEPGYATYLEVGKIVGMNRDQVSRAEKCIIQKLQDLAEANLYSLRPVS